MHPKSPNQILVMGNVYRFTKTLGFISYSVIFTVNENETYRLMIHGGIPHLVSTINAEIEIPFHNTKRLLEWLNIGIIKEVPQSDKR